MKNVLVSLLALVLVASLAQAQNQRGDGQFDRFIPITLSAGTGMSGRTDAAALDDTTQALDIRGFTYVGVVLAVATNDSASALVAYQGSHDKSQWSAFAVIDSLSTTGTVGINKSMALPDAALAYDYVRIRVYGSDSGKHSANPSSTITTYIVKRQ